MGVQKGDSKKVRKTDSRLQLTGAAETAPGALFMDSVLLNFRVPNGRQQRAVEKAQMIMYDAWEAPTRKRMLELCNEALAVSPDCADAYVMLAGESRYLPEAIAHLRRGVEAGARAIGKKAFKESEGHFWGILETRPYMRALQGLAMELWSAGQREESVGHFWELLRLNPNDNQGNRDLLLPRLIELGRDEDAERLYKQYKSDGMATWRYSRALLDFRKHGGAAVSKKSLDAALTYNPHVAAYVLGLKKLPKYLPGYHGIGDENEAVGYVFENFGAWESTPGSLDWMVEISGASMCKGKTRSKSSARRR